MGILTRGGTTSFDNLVLGADDPVDIGLPKTALLAQYAVGVPDWNRVRYRSGGPRSHGSGHVAGEQTAQRRVNGGVGTAEGHRC